MNHEQAEWVLKALANQTAALERIAAAVEQMALVHKPVVIPRGATIDHSAAKPWGGVTVGHFDADGTR